MPQGITFEITRLLDYYFVCLKKKKGKILLSLSQQEEQDPRENKGQAGGEVGKKRGGRRVSEWRGTRSEGGGERRVFG